MRQAAIWLLTLTAKPDKIDTSDMLIGAENHFDWVSLRDTLSDTKVVRRVRIWLWIVSSHLATGFGDGVKRWI